MAIEVRATKPDEFRLASNAVSTALLFQPHDDESWERTRPSWDEQSSTSAWDGERCVGHAAQFFVETTVPGGERVLTGAVTRVGVLPTHRRLGIASSLLEALIAEAAQRHAVLMSLRASEAMIYGRYGFGIAGEYTEVTIDPARARPVSGAATGGTFRLLSGDEIEAMVRPIYDAAHRRPGMVSRPSSWWRGYLGDAMRGTKPSFVVVHLDRHGTPDGYVHYDVAWNEDGPLGGHGEVHDVIGVTDAVELALWSYILDIDLIRTWKAEERPLDDVLRAAVADRRAYATTSVDDEQWLRIVDVDAALSARAYNDANGSLTISVTDERVPPNTGAWVIDAAGARRIEADSELDADLAVDISSLSAAYLGGTGWHTLAAAGAIDVRNDKAIATADNLFASRPLPFSGSFF